MTIKEILNSKEHLLQKIPDRKWKFYLELHDVIFVHWQVELDELKEFVPGELEIDLWQGKPWVSLVALTLKNLRPRYVPAFPLISNFDEINLRTYVKQAGKQGIHFLSMEAGKKLSAKIARLASGLPYRYSKISRGKTELRSFNPEFHDTLEIKFSVENTISHKDPLDKWLTERYVLFQVIKDEINEFNIHHSQWPLRNIEIEKLKMDYRRFKGLVSNTPHKMHYSKGVEVLTWHKISKIKMEETD